MTEIKVREMTIEDIPETVEVFQKAFNSIGQGWSVEGSRAYVEEHQKCTCKLVAEIKSQIVGFIIGDKDVDTLFVHSIGVNPENMQQGIGKALWDAAQKQAKEKGLNELRLIADPKSIAYAWYKRLGFTETGWVEMGKQIKEAK
ncbi:MAG: GNAT family N-acetyltransferase [Candidatus Dojkabacteria bacterium]|jgi:ribosomal protein S18 acetylase RimI-like enzyme|nr:GNAT family N-acetyltransferase [Candidatus Dojkabacteria bacterium]